MSAVRGLTMKAFGKRVINGVLAPFGVRVVRRRSPTTGHERSLAEAFEGVPRPFVLDVGANVGQAALQVLSVRPGAQIHSFEPGPDAVRALVENVRGHDVRVHEIALGDTDATRSFVEFPNSQVNSLLPPAADSNALASYLKRGHRTRSVSVRRLDEYLRSEGLDRPVDLLKIDVQGYECPVLRGAKDTLKRTRFVMIELMFTPAYEGASLVDEACHLLYESGFRLVRTIGFMPSEAVEDLVSADFFFRGHASDVR